MRWSSGTLGNASSRTDWSGWPSCSVKERFDVFASLGFASHSSEQRVASSIRHQRIGCHIRVGVRGGWRRSIRSGAELCTFADRRQRAETEYDEQNDRPIPVRGSTRPCPARRHGSLAATSRPSYIYAILINIASVGIIGDERYRQLRHS